MNVLEQMSPTQWDRVLQTTFGQVSANEQCAPILRAIGRSRLQILLRDRPELSYWEDYDGDRVVPHLGVAAECDVEAATTFRVFTDTLLRRLSVMEAAADELWCLRGDTETLMRCANILPHVMAAFARALEAEHRMEAP
jgi:hypothetical protein